MSRVLITGGCGFVGANLAPVVRELGHDVAIVDNLSRGDVSFLDDAGAYELIQADIRDSEAMRAACRGRDAVTAPAQHRREVRPDEAAAPGEQDARHQRVDDSACTRCVGVQYDWQGIFERSQRWLYFFAISVTSSSRPFCSVVGFSPRSRKHLFST